MTEQKLGRILICSGIILIALAIGLVVYNRHEDQQAGETAAAIGARVEALSADTGTETDSDAMDTVQVDGHSYIGMISIPALDVNLPVMEDWSLADLKIAPCRYQGTVKGKDLIICAHNYKKHFGLLNTLAIGDEVTFTDVKGSSTVYQVTEITLLQPSDVEQMAEGDWDLTLFSCTYMGYARVTVRCQQVS